MIIWVERIISLAVVLQTIEFLQLREEIESVWSWSIIREEFAGRKILDLLLSYPNFLGVLGLRLICAIAILFVPHPAFMILLLLSTVLISLRWRGTFNGGSDFMTLLVLMALSVATLFPQVERGCLWYIAIQTCTSYFIAGWAKLRRRNWREGRALSGFLTFTIYGPTRLSFSRLASWAILGFEITFPLALLNSRVCVVYIALALVFHIANSFLFGLNRFFFAWSAAYPALYYCSKLNLLVR